MRSCRPGPTPTRRIITWPVSTPPAGPLHPPSGAASTRAQVFAWYDYIKSELPDVFFVQNPTRPALYPLNFAANPYPRHADRHRPLRSGQLHAAARQLGRRRPLPATATARATSSNLLGTGILRRLVLRRRRALQEPGLPADRLRRHRQRRQRADRRVGRGRQPVDPCQPGTVQANLDAHQHNTARSEMLYAILVEGVGPLGSVFSRDDFSDREVKDTDGDGLPEFVDAWGQPLQFFRWPLLYHTDTQRGQVIDYWDYTQTPPVASAVELFNPPYRSVFEAREQDPLDPNQQLMAPAWWSSSATGPANPTRRSHAHRVPQGRSAAAAGCWPSSTSSTGSPSLSQHTGDAHSSTGTGGRVFPSRRAFFSKPLISLRGPDQQLGVFLCTRA